MPTNGIRLSVRQRAALRFGVTPTFAGIGLVAYVVATNAQPAGLARWVLVGLVLAPAIHLLVHYHLRTHDGFLRMAATTTIGTSISVGIAYGLTVLGAATAVWFVELATNEQARSVSVAICGAATILAGLVLKLWRTLR